MDTTDTTDTARTTTPDAGTPDIGFFFAVHRHLRADLRRYRETVTTATEPQRADRLPALTRWVRGFIHELEEHHYVEDRFFFPDMRAKVPAVVPILERLEADHRRLDGLLASWPAASRALADPSAPFARAQDVLAQIAVALEDLLLPHLDVEDHDVLPLYWRHYTAAEYDAVFQRAVKQGKKAGLGFVVPWNVDCLDGAERAAFVAGAPVAMRVLHRLVRPRYDRLVAEAFGPHR